jgi:hypothetical protein
MKRFVLVLALVGVAGATYVATAPGSQTAGPSGSQFKALKKQVAKLQKDEANVKSLAVAEAGLLIDCMAHSVPIKPFGDFQNTPATFGYSYSDPSINSGTPFAQTALNITANDDQDALWITGGTPSCGTDLNGASLRKVARLAGVRFHPTALRGGFADVKH